MRGGENHEAVFKIEITGQNILLVSTGNFSTMKPGHARAANAGFIA
jgi:hypothetical protein